MRRLMGILGLAVSMLVGAVVAPGAAFAADRDGTCDSGEFCYYYNSDFGGASQTFAAGAKGNLNATLKNNNASHDIGGSSGGTFPADPRASEAVAFAKARLGHTDWNNECELFVERAFGTSGRFATATAHYQWQKANGRIHTGSVPPAGAAVFFTSTTSAGHIMLSIGGNSAISTGPTVYQTNTFRQRSDYLGWAYVPSSW